MSTGNNKDETLVSKKRKRHLTGYIHPNKPEIKRFDFFTGGYSDTGQFRIINSQEFVPTIAPFNPPANGHGSWELIKMGNPSQGPLSYDRIGMKYFLKYIKFKGHISINVVLPFTIRYKLVLIKSDHVLNTIDDLMGRCFTNFEPMSTTINQYEAREQFCRHNFYKTMKWATGCAESRTSFLTVSSGTLTPPAYIDRPTKTSTLGSQPSWAYTVPDMLRFGLQADEDSVLNQTAYLPINVSCQVNDNVEVNVTHFYLLLMTDHGIGTSMPSWSSSSGANFYRANISYAAAVARFNFFGVCYFSDL